MNKKLTHKPELCSSISAATASHRRSLCEAAPVWTFLWRALVEGLVRFQYLSWYIAVPVEDPRGLPDQRPHWWNCALDQSSHPCGANESLQRGGYHLNPELDNSSKEWDIIAAERRYCSGKLDIIKQTKKHFHSSIPALFPGNTDTSCAFSRPTVMVNL